MPEGIKAYNNGKGAPLEYTLFPLKKLEEFFQFEQTVNRLTTTVDMGSVVRVEQQLNAISEAKQDFNDFMAFLSVNRELVRDQDTVELNDYQQEIALSEAIFRQNLGEVLVKVRTLVCPKMQTSSFM